MGFAMICSRCHGDEVVVTVFPGADMAASALVECQCGFEEWLTAEELSNIYAMERDIQRAVDPRGAAEWERWVAAEDDWPGEPATGWPADPYDEDGYCEFCGNGRRKFHAPWCKWADAMEAQGHTEDLQIGEPDANPESP